MPRAPREVRERRLARFLRHKEETEANITRLEELLERIRNEEAVAQDDQEAKRYIATRLNLEAGLSDARAFLLRTTKAVEKEQEWLARYDEEDQQDDSGDDSDVQDEEDHDTYQRTAQNTISDAEKALALAEADTRRDTPAPYHTLLRLVASGRTPEVTLGDIDSAMRRYAKLCKQPSIMPAEERLKAALLSALKQVDKRMVELRFVWDRLRRL